MLGFTTLSNWFRSANSIGNELEAKLKQAETDIDAEWKSLVARIEAIEAAIKGQEPPATTQPPATEPSAAPSPAAPSPAA